MKILILNTVPFRVNGMSSNIFNYYDLLKKRQNLILDFFVSEYMDSRYQNKVNNNSQLFINKNRKRHPFSWLKHLRYLLKNTSYDIIHIHGNSSLMILEAILIKIYSKQTKVIAHTHSVNTEFPILNKLLKRIFFKVIDVGFAASKESGEWLFGEQQFYIVNNGIDTDKFKFSKEKRSILRTEFNLSENQLVLVHVGMFNRVKNQEFLIELISNKHFDAILFLIGDGDSKKDLIKKVKYLKIDDKVVFVDTTFNVEDYYNMADLFVFPSKFESLGMALIEAQSTGLPCVVSSVIPESACISDLVKKVSLDQEKRIWLEVISDSFLKSKSKNNRSNYNSIIKNSDFDIVENEKKVYEKYLEIIK